MAPNIGRRVFRLFRKLSLRSAGEKESTVLEEQRLGGISKVKAELQKNTTGVDENANQKDTLQTETPAASQRHKSEIEEDVIEGEDEVVEEEEVEEEVEDEEAVEDEEEEDNEEEEGDEDDEESGEADEEIEVEEDESEQPAPMDLSLTETAATTPSPIDATEEVSLKLHAKETESNDEPPLTASSELIAVNTTAITHDDDEKGDHHEKPAIPPQTYLWKEVEKSKEQGGYPWTHLYKNPLGPDDEPEVILRYTQSPVNRRRKVEEQLIDGSSREEKKAKTENGFEATESTETDSPLHEPPITPETATSITTEISDGETNSPRRSRTRAASHEPNSLKEEFRAHAKHFLDEHPSIRSFSNSLTRKGKRTRAFVSRSLERAKSMADKQIDKAKVQMNTLRRRKAASEPPRDLPDHKILMLRESPRFGNREIPAYVIRQPSDEAMDTSDTEAIEKTLLETTTVVPDEIIELPQQAASEPAKTETPAEKMEVEEERYEIIEPPKDDVVKPTIPDNAVQIVPEEVKPQPPPKAPRKKKEHHYEDIDDYVPQKEEQNDSKLPLETKLKRQHEVDGFDPIVGEMLGNDKIKISLQLQDEMIANDMLDRKKRLDEILQHSSEDEKDKDKIPSLGLLAPISSIDSTSSDEDARRTRLSALTEESDTGSVDNSVLKKQDSARETDLPVLKEGQKELELTPAEEKKILEDRDQLNTSEEEKVVDKQLELTPAEERMLFEAEAKAQITPVEEKVLNTESLVEKELSAEESKPVTDERWSKMSDHEYEPIGEPVEDKNVEAAKGSLALPTDDKKRKLSTSSLRVPLDEGDTISMEELQKDIEDRYFNRPSVEQATIEFTEPVEVAAQEKTSKVKSAMARAQESGKKAMAKAQVSSRNAMVKAQEGGKSLHQKLRKQTDKFKTKMTNINIKKDKDVAPLATPEIVTTPEIEKLDFTLAEPSPEHETGELESVPAQADEATAEVENEEVVPESGATKKKFRAADFSKIKNIQMPKIHKPEFKRPEFTKISKPKMPKLKTPDMSKFKRPEMPKFLTEKPDFSKLKMPEKIGTIKIQRSKSMKEPVLSSATSAASPSEIEAPSTLDGDGTKKKLKYNDFSTYPRLLDKFKRQKPSNESVRASTPPPLEFTKVAKTSRTKGTGFVSRWAEKSSEDTGSTRFFTGSEIGEREGSVEKRIRQRLERADFDEPELAVTAEQKQLEEYDKENREIHLLSAARHDEFMKRKPPMERQESDLASEEEKQFWASSLGQKIRQNIDMNSNDFDFLDEEDRLRSARENETMALSAHDRARFLGEPLGEQSEKDYDMRSTTPYSNKECQSSGSSGIRRRKGVIEEIDDDEFFLRQKGISKDNIQMGEYISTAIKEGLSTPKNALAEMGSYDPYFDDEADVSERMSVDYRAEHAAGGRYYQPSFESDDVSNKQSFTDEFRKQADFFKTFPPDRPIRKHKKSYNDDQLHDDHQKVPYDSYQQEEEQDVEFYGRDRKYGAEPQENRAERDERFIDEESVGNGFTLTGSAVPPTPPRRRKKRFREFTPSELTPFGDGLTSKPIYNSYTLGPETHIFNTDIPLAQEESFTTPLPTPRRSRSRSQLSKFDDDRTSRGAESYIFGAEDNALVKLAIDMSESNGYATVRKEPPPRPPAPIRRRKSTRSLGDQRQFNTLPNFHSASPARPSRNYSTINPNRPPRGRSVSSLNESATKLSTISKDDITQYEDIEAVGDQVKLHETLQSGDVVKKMKDRPLPPPPRPPRDNRKARRYDQDDRFDFDGGTERIIPLDTIEPRVIEEVEIAIQTDPVSDDFELDIEVSETMAKPGKTLQEILKEEQQAEIDRARQLAEASNLMRDIQKFRDSTSSLSLHGSRPETPSAMTFERRVSAPSTSQIVPGLSSENLTEQDLANIDDDKFIAELVKKYVSEEKVTDNGKKPFKTMEEPRLVTERAEQEKLREIESMIVQENVQREDIRAVQSGPAAPPRRRSLVSSTHDIPTSIEIPQNVIEEIVERLRTNEQQHIAELEQLHQQQLDELRKQQEEQRVLQEQKLTEQQKMLFDQQNQQLHETQQLKEQIFQQQEQQMALLQQQQQQQQQLLLAQQQQQILLQQQEKERELQRERERELLREREIELEKSRERERELHHARELELQRARELEQQRAKELEHQRLRELELQRTMELEHQRLRELELQRVQEAEVQRAREAELQRAREADLQRVRETEIQRIRETELLRAQEAEILKLKEIERKVRESQAKEEGSIANAADETVEPLASAKMTQEVVETSKEASVSEQKPTVEPAPVRPPPPRISPQIPINAQFPYQEYLSYPLPPPPFYPTRNHSDEEGAFPQAPHRRRRHHRSRRESTSEEEFQREQRKQRHGTRSPEPSIPALGSQLIRACGASIRETGDELMSILRASSKDENKRDLHIALIILIVIVAGLMALGMSGEQSVHHHHWDYFTPPGNSGH
ncbi:trichohyalin isoform X3 [Armigeres subalbatus]|uniref:trichohyalin isoform X3 n=1 Tax=Armigeres subalbatus TaxID=124917 RepID=UPI002ED5B169